MSACGLLLLGCGLDDPCVAMCEAATDRFADCLTEWDASWENAGYADATDFTHTCDTWAWEQRQLERKARRTGALDSRGEVDRACESYAEALTSSEADCEAYTSISWNDSPWESPP